MKEQIITAHACTHSRNQNNRYRNQEWINRGEARTQPSPHLLDSEFFRMPFGLRNAAQTFQRFIDQVLRGLPPIYAYIDDILIASTSKEEHLTHLQEVCERLDSYGITLNPAKCVLGVESLEFLGHKVDKHGIRPLETKLDVVRQFPQPTTQRKLRQFLGLINFYHRFIPGGAHMLQPLDAMLTGSSRGD